ncbi:MAG: histidine kinase [Lachnospiraceae bacterium]|nr:histidine kinase [Lachnospiraceae bacterium]
MSGWSNYLWVSIVSAALMLSLIAIWFSTVIPGMDRWSRRFFRSYFIVFILCCLSSLTEMAFYHYHAPVGAIYTVMIAGALFLSLPLPMLTVYLLHYCGESIPHSKLLKAVIVLMVIYVMVLAGTLITGGLWYVAPDWQFYRGPLYPLLPLPLIAILIINFSGTLHRRKLLSHKVFLSFLVALVPVLATMIVQLFADALLLVDISFVLSGLSMYSFVLADQIEQDLRRQSEIAEQKIEIAGQKMEIANQRANIMILQMRPHFIYNTMMSIYYLCKQDPDMAQQVTLDFTTYLRKNFSAIASAEMIPFSSELEHTHAYLAVEQALYKNTLLIDYDTPHTFFRIPPLTLQPIVENAVKHGRDPYIGPFRISIFTKKSDCGSEIIVEDSGRGFEPAEVAEPGTALENIRQRLEMMCDGSMTIKPREGGGTVVTIVIPNSSEQKKGLEEL